MTISALFLSNFSCCCPEVVGGGVSLLGPACLELRERGGGELGGCGDVLGRSGGGGVGRGLFREKCPAVWLLIVFEI